MKLKKLTKGDKETGMQIKAVIPENTTSLIHVPVLSSKDFTISVNDKKNQQVFYARRTKDTEFCRSEFKGELVFF